MTPIQSRKEQNSARLNPQKDQFLDFVCCIRIKSKKNTALLNCIFEYMFLETVNKCVAIVYPGYLDDSFFCFLLNQHAGTPTQKIWLQYKLNVPSISILNFSIQSIIYFWLVRYYCIRWYFHTFKVSLHLHLWKLGRQEKKVRKYLCCFTGKRRGVSHACRGSFASLQHWFQRLNMLLLLLLLLLSPVSYCSLDM